MAIPLHTFEPTGDPLVDKSNYSGGNPIVTLKDWFSRNPHVLMHRPEMIVSEAVKFMDIERAPFGSGIYFLIHHDRIAYVGRTRCIYDRLEGHWRTGKTFDKYWCFGGVPYDWLNHVEGYYIKLCRPYLNVATVTYDKTLSKIARDTAKQQFAM